MSVHEGSVRRLILITLGGYEKVSSLFVTPKLPPLALAQVLEPPLGKEIAAEETNQKNHENHPHQRRQPPKGNCYYTAYHRCHTVITGVVGLYTQMEAPCLSVLTLMEGWMYEDWGVIWVPGNLFGTIEGGTARLLMTTPVRASTSSNYLHYSAGLGFYWLTVRGSPVAAG
jgi:hypothetical protein